MCGIVALVTSRPPDGLERLVADLTNTLAHRGPDDFGVEVFPDEGVALGMRRLSILDLEGGHQPMWDERRRRCVVFNGEIYNAAELRRELERAGHRFATDHSDTEVLVHGFEEWGSGLAERLNGMFAFALWDRDRRELHVARDRAGEKPLYVATVPGGYALASELKALLPYPGLDRELDLAAVEQYLDFGYVLAPRTILARVRKLPAGCHAVVTPERYEPRRYWSPRFAGDAARNGAAPDERELVEELDRLLDDSVRLRMVADVPVGLLLSGGIDSTTVGWYMRRHSDDVHSFSIGFEEHGYDESHYSALAAEHLGTTHHLEVLSQEQARELVPRIAEILDEPMGDQSIFPTYLLSAVTRKGVKVALGGDGSDELLMGYHAYEALRLSGRLTALPRPARRAVAALARRLPLRVGPVALRGVRSARAAELGTADRLLTYLGMFKGDARTLLAPDARAELPQTVFDGVGTELLAGVPAGVGADNEAIAAFVRGYLADDILVKTDRASMAASLELRAPFLDPRVIDFLLSVPPGLKLRGGTRKYLLRRVMADRIPSEVVDRPKRGFDVPLNAWMRDSLAPLVRDLLSPERVARAGLLRPAAVDRLVREHLEGRVDRGRELWLLVQLELWRERWLGP
jgi:asparagine synthase (glutamine-hydrolysing)